MVGDDASIALFTYAVYDVVTNELLASLSVEGPRTGEGVLHFAAFHCGELFESSYYLRTIPDAE